MAGRKTDAARAWAERLMAWSGRALRSTWLRWAAGAGVVLLVGLVAVWFLPPAAGAAVLGLMAGCGGGSGTTEPPVDATGTVSGTVTADGNALGGVEVALSLILLVGAGLMVRSFLGVAGADIGMPVSSTLSMRLTLAGDRYDPVEERIAFFEDAAERIEGLPGVAGAAAMSAIPADDGGPAVPVRREEGEPLETAPVATLVGATAGAFEALGVGLLAGREFTGSEARDTSSAVAVVGESLARRLFGGTDAVGRTILVDGEVLEVVGVVPDIVYEELGEQSDVSRLQVHVPYAFLGWRGMALLVRGEGDAGSLTGPVRAELRDMDPVQAPFDVMTMVERRRFTSWPQRFFGGLFVQFGAVALLLAGAGVYGVVAYGVARRRRELGLRLALGAPRSALLAGVVKTSLIPAAIGTAAGLGGAWALSRLLSSLLYGVSGTDALTFAGAGAVMGLVALAATWLPARRALGLDPSETLRAE
ncbi:MAG: ABC transporter permease [Gemmatimonadetes bacterium]|nr:ABC transporter permease [Gemmatimonadota bacterium]